MPAHNVNWDAIEWVQVRHGMERKTFAGEGATLALFRIQPDHERLPHAHHYEQIVYMLRGTANFHVGDEVHLMTGGYLLVIPPTSRTTSTCKATRRCWSSTCSRPGGRSTAGRLASRSRQ